MHDFYHFPWDHFPELDMRTNTKAAPDPTLVTHEGAPARRISAELELRRSVMACLLFEDTFYESGEDHATRVRRLVTEVDPAAVAAIAVEAREAMKLRHMPLLLARELARRTGAKPELAPLLERIVQRPDELGEFLSLYWASGRDGQKHKIANAAKRGLARAFRKFNAYSLAKYNSDATIKLRDVLFLVHAKPKDAEQAAVWKQLVDGTLPAPDTWEVALSAGADKRETWERLLAEQKLGALALLRNLRNMEQAGVPEDVVRHALGTMKTERVLPFRFITAARYAPQYEPELEAAMLRSIEGQPKLPGKTVLVVDGSGSMFGQKVSKKSELDRFDAAAALAILVREVCDPIEVIVFSNNAILVPARRGFALRDIMHGVAEGQGTDTRNAINQANLRGYDRIIVITDEQSHTAVSGPLPGAKGYFLNVATYKNGIGYGPWTHIDGWSEAVIEYIRAAEGHSSSV